MYSTGTQTLLALLALLLDACVFQEQHADSRRRMRLKNIMYLHVALNIPRAIAITHLAMRSPDRHASNGSTHVIPHTALGTLCRMVESKKETTVHRRYQLSQPE